MKQSNPNKHVLMRNIPSVDLVLGMESIQPLMNGFGKDKVTDVVREVLSEMREAILSNAVISTEEVSLASVEKAIQKKMESISLGRLQKVINATGVVLHTN